MAPAKVATLVGWLMLLCPTFILVSVSNLDTLSPGSGSVGSGSDDPWGEDPEFNETSNGTHSQWVGNYSSHVERLQSVFDDDFPTRLRDWFLGAIDNMSPRVLFACAIMTLLPMHTSAILVFFAGLLMKLIMWLLCAAAPFVLALRAAFTPAAPTPPPDPGSGALDQILRDLRSMREEQSGFRREFSGAVDNLREHVDTQLNGMQAQMEDFWQAQLPNPSEATPAATPATSVGVEGAPVSSALVSHSDLSVPVPPSDRGSLGLAEVTPRCSGPPPAVPPSESGLLFGVDTEVCPSLSIVAMGAKINDSHQSVSAVLGKLRNGATAPPSEFGASTEFSFAYVGTVSDIQLKSRERVCFQFSDPDGKLPEGSALERATLTQRLASAVTLLLDVEYSWVTVVLSAGSLRGVVAIGDPTKIESASQSSTLSSVYAKAPLPTWTLVEPTSTDEAVAKEELLDQAERFLKVKKEYAAHGDLKALWSHGVKFVGADTKPSGAVARAQQSYEKLRDEAQRANCVEGLAFCDALLVDFIGDWLRRHGLQARTIPAVLFNKLKRLRYSGAGGESAGSTLASFVQDWRMTFERLMSARRQHATGDDYLLSDPVGSHVERSTFAASFSVKGPASVLTGAVQERGQAALDVLPDDEHKDLSLEWYLDRLERIAKSNFTQEARNTLAATTSTAKAAKASSKADGPGAPPAKAKSEPTPPAPPGGGPGGGDGMSRRQRQEQNRMNALNFVPQAKQPLCSEVTTTEGNGIYFRRRGGHFSHHHEHCSDACGKNAKSAPGSFCDGAHHPAHPQTGVAMCPQQYANSRKFKAETLKDPDGCSCLVDKNGLPPPSYWSNENVEKRRKKTAEAEKRQSEKTEAYKAKNAAKASSSSGKAGGPPKASLFNRSNHITVPPAPVDEGNGPEDGENRTNVLFPLLGASRSESAPAPSTESRPVVCDKPCLRLNKITPSARVKKLVFLPCNVGSLSLSIYPDGGCFIVRDCLPPELYAEMREAEPDRVTALKPLKEPMTCSMAQADAKHQVEAAEFCQVYVALTSKTGAVHSEWRSFVLIPGLNVPHLACGGETVCYDWGASYRRLKSHSEGIRDFGEGDFAMTLLELDTLCSPILKILPVHSPATKFDEQKPTVSTAKTLFTAWAVRTVTLLFAATPLLRTCVIVPSVGHCCC
eukprot:g16427.t1